MSLTFTTVGALIGGLPNIYANRLDLNNIADGSKAVSAMKKAIDELTETYELEELKYQTPIPPATPLNMTLSNPIIPISTITGTIQGNANYPQFQNQNFVDITDVYTFWEWFPTGVSGSGRALKYRRVTTVDQDSYGITSSTQGAIGLAPPVYYTRFGSVLQVGPAPDNNYQYFVRCKLRHPFPITEPFTPAVLIPQVSGAGVITGVTVASQGNGYPLPPTIVPLVFGSPSPPGIVASGTANILGGIVTGVSLSNGGTNYTVNSATCNTAAIASQTVFAPSTWHEIIQYSACLRIAANIGELSYMQSFDAFLKLKGIDIPKARALKAQMERDERHNERNLTLQLGGRYTFA